MRRSVRTIGNNIESWLTRSRLPLLAKSPADESALPCSKKFNCYGPTCATCENREYIFVRHISSSKLTFSLCFQNPVRCSRWHIRLSTNLCQSEWRAAPQQTHKRYLFLACPTWKNHIVSICWLRRKIRNFNSFTKIRTLWRTSGTTWSHGSNYFEKYKQ